jgi:intracellular multiplication protein IcmK
MSLIVGIFMLASAFSFSVAHAQSASSTTDPTSGMLPTQIGAITNPAALPVNPSPTLPKVMPPTSAADGSISIPSPPPAPSFAGNATPVEQQAAQQAAQQALQAQAQADQAQAQREQEHIEKSFDRASAGLLPLSPDQIRGFMHKLEQTQEAALPPYNGTPNGQVRIATLSLDPGTQPPQINLASGYVTTINIFDATGEPWPILDVGVGGNFEVSPTQAGTQVVRVMPLTRVGTGNLSILLKDLPTPVILRLSAGGPNVDLRYDARVPKYGPNAKMPIIDRPRLEAGDESIMLMLANVPPTDAKRMKVAGLDARTMAWVLNNHVYVRTPLTLLSPAWNASVSSGDGMTVYEIGDAPVLLMSDNGAVVRAQLMRDDDHDK